MRKILIVLAVIAIAGCGRKKTGETPQQAKDRQRRKQLRLLREDKHKELGAELAGELHKIGVEIISQGKEEADKAIWDTFRGKPKFVDAMLIRIDVKMRRSFLMGTASGTNPAVKKRGDTEDMADGTRFTKGAIVRNGVETPAWIFELSIKNDKGVSVGRATIFLDEPGK